MAHLILMHFILLEAALSGTLILYSGNSIAHTLESCLLADIALKYLLPSLDDNAENQL